MQTMLDHALTYAEKAGWRVFPCKLDKSPYTPHGCKDATTDIEQIRKWWQQWPDASIGCACGPESGIWVLDIDLPDGPEALKRLIAEYGPLPETRMQKTGGGGVQYFFEWNGTVIKNTAKQIGPGIDTRGFNGYIILPPSPHPSGGTYQWTKRMVKLPHAPAWLSDMAAKRESTLIYPSINQGPSQYGQKALAGEIIKLTGASFGNRNNQLNESAFSLGQLVAGGELEHGTVFNALFGLAMSLGLPGTEARKTIESGIKAGMQEPRKAPEPETDDFYFDPVSSVNEISEISEVSKLNIDKHGKHQSASSKQMVSKMANSVSKSKQDGEEGNAEPPQNLTWHIEQFIENSSGCFHTRDIDNEFGLKTRKEKNARSAALNKMARKKLIIKDKAAAGKWHIINKEIEFVDIHAPAEEAYDIALPFNLNNHVLIPPHSIIVIAGSGDAGKTTFILNILKQNRGKTYNKFYLMSEMGRGEYIRKIKMFGEPLEKWECIKAAPRSYDFNGVIEHHNKDGLTCIDYLEEIQGEYFKITSQIRDIYDALGDGVAVVAIQKDSKAAYARGGEGTMEKSRLYLSIDYLCTVPRGVVCAIKIMKAKNFINDNYKNYELHFKIHGKNEMEVLMDWTPSSQVDRKKMTAIYESGRDLEDVMQRDYAYVFKTKTGRLVGLNYKDRDRWVKQFGSFVDEKLSQIQESSQNSPWLKDDWFPQISGILGSHKEKIEQKDRHRADIDG